MMIAHESNENGKTDNLAKGLFCKECGKSFPLSMSNACDECFAPLEVRYDENRVEAALSRKNISAGPPSIWRYWPLLPVNPAAGRAGLNPGLTPLRNCKNLAEEIGIRELFIKDDTVNPTYSFKDRPVAVSIPKILEFGLDGVGCASTGNLAGATAAAAARYRIPCYVIIPADTDRTKILSALAYGAKVISVEGTYDDANRISNLITDRLNIGFVNINLRPYYVEGSKTLAMEVVEQLGWEEPDRMIVPIGSGALLTAVNKGLNEFRRYGISEGNCIISGAQPSGCSTVADAYARGDDIIRPVRDPDTVAESLAIGNPASGLEALSIIRETGGFADAPSDSEIIEGQMLLARKEGIFTEPAGGTVIASLRRKVEDGTISGNERVVCLITGNGLKTPSHLTGDVVGSTYEVKAEIENVLPIFGYNAGTV